MSKQAEKKAETIVDVQQVYSRTEKFLDQNRKALTIGLGAIVVLFGGFSHTSICIKNQKRLKRQTPS